MVEYDDRLLNPNTAWFKLQNNTLKHVIGGGSTEGTVRPNLLRELTALNATIEFVNQQVEEVRDHRFSSPSMLGEACRTLRSRSSQQRQTELFEMVKLGRLMFPNLLDWWQELAHRHWAIVNEGYYNRLIPAFKRVEQPLNEELKKAGLEPLGLVWPQWLVENLETIRRERATPDA